MAQLKLNKIRLNFERGEHPPMPLNDKLKFESINTQASNYFIC